MDNTEGQLTPTLQKSINQIIEKKNFTPNKISIKLLSTEGASFLGELYEVNIDGETLNNGKNIINLFVKKNVSRSIADKYLSVNTAYVSEKFFYNELTKIYMELQEKACIPLNAKFNWVKSYDVANLDGIILENMSVKGYSIPKRTEVLPLRFAELSIQQLAKFHGLSFVLRNKRKDIYDSKLRKMKYFVKLNDEFKATVSNLTNLTVTNVDSNTRKLIQTFKEGLLAKYPEYMNVGTQEETTVYCFCHGDYRHSNILMRKVNGKVLDVIPIDYQTLHHGCPVNDLIYLIYTGTDRNFRKKHMQNLKYLYYNTLSKFLQYFELNVEEIYPRNEFETVFKERLDYGLILSILWFPIFFVVKQDAPDLDAVDMTTAHMKLNSVFSVRVKEIWNEFRELGYFD